MPAKAKLTTRERSTSNVTSDNLNKGSELSFAEADSNFINLRDQSIAISDGSTSTDIEAGETITFSGASVSGNTVTVPTGAGMNIVGDDSTGTLINAGETLKIAGGSNVTTAMSGDTLTITASGGGGSSGGNLGDLQVNGTTLSPVTTNADLNLTANGTGQVDIFNSKFSTGTSTIGSVNTTMNTIDGGSSTGPSRLVLKATGGTDDGTGRDENSIFFESHNGEFYFQKTGGTIANITTEVGSGQQLKISAKEGRQTNAGGFTIDGTANAAITFNQKIDMNNFAIENLPSLSVSEITVTGDAGITLNDNVISTSATNTDIELDPAGTGQILLKSDTTAIGDGSGSEAALLTTPNDVPLHIGPNTSQANLTATNGLTSNSDGYIRLNNNGLISVRAAGDGYIYLEGETVLFGRPGVGGTSAAGKISSLGRQNFTITANNNVNGWEPVILLTAPGGGSSASDKAQSKITMQAGDTGSGSIEMTTINILMTRLPTSDPSVAGQLYNDSGTLKISAG